jgi:mannose-6-phosphate isomerase
MEKREIFDKVAAKLAALGFTPIKKDDTRPWGGFYVLDEAEAMKFAKHYFPDEEFPAHVVQGKMSPKILIVAPHKRLSWQYHFRRAEIWKCIGGVAGVVTSDTDDEKDVHTLRKGDIIRLKQGERHRLMGLDTWAVVAEIWMHTDAANPSNEEDIVRLQDDFGR